MTPAPRELLPLPRVVVGPGPMRRLGRRTSQRIGRRRALQQQVRDTVDAWNWMGGHSVPAAPGFETEAQASAIKRARASAALIEPPTESRQAALSALLTATAGYGSAEGVGDVAAFVAGGL